MKQCSLVHLIIETLEERSLPSVTPVYYSVDGSGNNLTHPGWGMPTRLFFGWPGLLMAMAFRAWPVLIGPGPG